MSNAQVNIQELIIWEFLTYELWDTKEGQLWGYVNQQPITCKMSKGNKISDITKELLSNDALPCK
jgi:hypothetical protein